MLHLSDSIHYNVIQFQLICMNVNFRHAEICMTDIRSFPVKWNILGYLILLLLCTFNSFILFSVLMELGSVLGTLGPHWKMEPHTDIDMTMLNITGLNTVGDLKVSERKWKPFKNLATWVRTQAMYSRRYVNHRKLRIWLNFNYFETNLDSYSFNVHFIWNDTSWSFHVSKRLHIPINLGLFLHYCIYY